MQKLPNVAWMFSASLRAPSLQGNMKPFLHPDPEPLDSVRPQTESWGNSTHQQNLKPSLPLQKHS